MKEEVLFFFVLFVCNNSRVDSMQNNNTDNDEQTTNRHTHTRTQLKTNTEKKRKKQRIKTVRRIVSFKKRSWEIEMNMRKVVG